MGRVRAESDNSGTDRGTKRCLRWTNAGLGALAGCRRTGAPSAALSPSLQDEDCKVVGEPRVVCVDFDRLEHARADVRRGRGGEALDDQLESRFVERMPLRVLRL